MLNTLFNLNLISSFGLKQHVKGPTHKSGHTLDLMISRNDDELLSSIEALDHGFPDHYAVLTSLLVKKPPLPRKTITYRNIKSISVDTLKVKIIQSSIQDFCSMLEAAMHNGLQPRTEMRYE